jgi:hypothetical protein
VVTPFRRNVLVKFDLTYVILVSHYVFGSCLVRQFQREGHEVRASWRAIAN